MPNTDFTAADAKLHTLAISYSWPCCKLRSQQWLRWSAVASSGYLGKPYEEASKLYRVSFIEQQRRRSRTAYLGQPRWTDFATAFKWYE